MRPAVAPDAVLAVTLLSARPRGKHGDGQRTAGRALGRLHMIEETARHAGHLDIARSCSTADEARAALTVPALAAN